MPANPLIELARTLVALRALAADLGIEWESVVEAADGFFSEANSSDVKPEPNTDR